jgi:uncharacterized membrane protein
LKVKLTRQQTKPAPTYNPFPSNNYKIKAIQNAMVMAATELVTPILFPAPRNTFKLGDGTVVASCVLIVIFGGVVGVMTGGMGTTADGVLVIEVSAGT